MMQRENAFTSEFLASPDFFIVRDSAEAGFGGNLNTFDLTKAMVEVGEGCVHFEDQLSSV
jgi:isocitrate lyase